MMLGYRIDGLHRLPPMGSQMADTDVEVFEKARVTKSYVEREQKQRIANGALKVELKEDEKTWVLITVWPAF